MSPIAISLLSLMSICIGMLFGMYLRDHLPQHHLSSDSKDVMKMGIGMIATMAALVLSLLISSSKGKFDTINSGLRETGAKIILLDRTMARYGPQTKEARDILHRGVITTISQLWPTDKNTVDVEKAGRQKVSIEDVTEKLRQLSPQNDEQRQLQSKALQISGAIEEERWLLVEQVGQSSFPMPFLVLLVCWLTVIFFGFSLFTSRNITVLAILFICALSAASSLYLILELDQPYAGLIKVSSTPLLNALAHLGQ